MLKSFYVDGQSWLHRTPVRLKLVALFIAGIVLVPLKSVALLGLAFTLALGLYASVGLPLKEALSRLSSMVILILLVAVLVWATESAMMAVAVFLRLLALVLLAASVTATTTINAFMEEITRLLIPLERIGLVNAADISLAFGLVLRFVPEVAARYQAIRDAHTARGLKMQPLTVLGPLIILTLKDAETIALAIDARGFRRS